MKLFLGLCVCFIASSVLGAVVINEVCVNPEGADTGLEWIELYNNGSETVSVKGYELYPDGIGYFTFPDTALGAGKFLVIHLRRTGIDTQSDLYFTTPQNNMGNSSGSIVLFDSSTHSSTTMVDFVQYGSKGQTWESAAVSAGIWEKDMSVTLPPEGGSFGLKINGDDTDEINNWVALSRPTPGADNQSWLKREEEMKSEVTGALQILQSPFSPFGDGRYKEAFIGVSVDGECEVSIKIFDSTGVHIKTLIENERMFSQKELMAWDGTDNNSTVVPIGIYVVYLEAVNVKTGEIIKAIKPVVVAGRLN